MKFGRACEAAAGLAAVKDSTEAPLPVESPAAAFQPVRQAHAAWLRTQPQMFLEVDDLTGPTQASPRAGSRRPGPDKENHA